MATKWDTIRDEWLDYVDTIAYRAETETRGYLLNREREEEFCRKYGAGYTTQGLFSDMTSAAAYYYASEELVDFWRQNPRLTWPEFAVQRGLRFAHIVRAARRAPGARAAAEARASERSRSGLGTRVA